MFYNDIYIYKEDCLCLSVSVCLNEFAQFSRCRAETLQVGRGRPGTGRGGDQIVGGATAGGTGAGAGGGGGGAGAGLL